MSLVRLAMVAAFTGAACAQALASGDTTRQACVVCQEPDAVYRCVLDSPGKQPRKSLSLFCAARIAEEHDHASCSVAQRAKCDGLEKIYSMDDVETGRALGLLSEGPGQSGETAPLPENAGDPPTLSQATRESIERSADATTRAGNAIGEAARRTWTCLNTFGRQC